MANISIEVKDELILPQPSNLKERDLFNALQDAHRDVAGTLQTLTAPPDEKVKATSSDPTEGYLEDKVDDTTIEVASNALQVKDGGIGTTQLSNDSVDKTKIASDVAGDGLVQAAGGEIDVNVDDSTLEINTDILRVKDAGITKAKIENLSNYTVLGNVSGTTATAAEIEILDEDDMISDSNTKIATQQSIKKYVDDEIAGLNIPSAGTRVTQSVGTVYQASEDRLVTANCVSNNGTSNVVSIHLLTDGSNPPTTEVCRSSGADVGAGVSGYGSITYMVKSGDYYKAVKTDLSSSGSSSSMSYVPFS